MASLRGISLGNISSLEGMETATGLFELKITNITLGDLDLSPVKNLPLQFLTLNKVNPGDLSILQNWKNLTELSLSSLPLTNAPEIGKLTQLTVLTLYDTNLTQLPANFNQLTKLLLLTLSDNPLSDISALGTPPLQGLDITNTQVSDISLIANNLSLRSIEMDGSEVSDLSVLPKGGQLTFVRANNTPVYDLTPLINRTPKLLCARFHKRQN
jgi:Leucine-rich repeat (LRR) protein